MSVLPRPGLRGLPVPSARLLIVFRHCEFINIANFDENCGGRCGAGCTRESPPLKNTNPAAPAGTAGSGKKKSGRPELRPEHQLLADMNPRAADPVHRAELRERDAVR